MFFLIAWVLFGFLGGKVVARKGYEPKYGVMLGLLGVIGLIVALLLPTTKSGHELQALEYEIANAPKRANCPNCGKQVEYGTISCPHCLYAITAIARRS